MSYFVYRPDANNFAAIGFSLADNDRIVGVHYTDKSLADEWIAPVAHGFNDNPETEGDFPSLSNFWRIPVMSQRAWEVLAPIIANSCEALPIIHPTGKPYFIIHVMDTIDGLDLSKSEFTCNPTTGRVNRIQRYVFKPDMLHGKYIFKLPPLSGGELILHDDIRNVVTANCLRGLRFKEIRM